MMKYGNDISRWQGTTDFVKMVNAGSTFVIFKAGQGTWKDQKFDDYIRDSKGILPRGAYWYYDNGVAPAKQASAFYTIIKDVELELPVFVDLEDRNAGNYLSMKHWAVFMEEFERLAGHKCNVYTGYYYWDEHYSPQFENTFKDVLLWMAWYGRAYEYLKIPTPWRVVTIHQFTDRADGVAHGVSTKQIDGNNFYGSTAEWNEFTSDFYNAEPEPPEPPTDCEAKIKASYNQGVADTVMQYDEVTNRLLENKERSER